MITTEARERLALLYSRDQIQDRVRALAREIHQDYKDRDLVVIGVLKGAFVFVADLIRAVHLPVAVEFIGLSTYGPETTPSGAPRITKPLELPVRGRDVLVVEDILDTGTTLKALLSYIRSHEPRSVRLCVLLDKRERRQESVAVDYVGFTVPGGFVVGYGIDYAERYRYLPEIWRVDPDEA